MTSLLIPAFSLILAFPTALPDNRGAKAQSQSSQNFIIQRKNKRPAVLRRGQRRPSPKVIAANIEKIVHEEFLDPDRESLERWSFTVYKFDKSLSVGSPGAPISLDPSDPHMLPFDAQYNLESVKTFLLKSDIPTSQWSPRLDAFRNAIYQTIVVIESTKNRDKLLKSLKHRAVLLNDLLDGLKDFIVNFYRAKGYEISLSPGHPMALAVPVATDPPGGTIKVMKYLNYKKCSLFPISIGGCSWLTLNQDKAPLLGKYRYLVSWPDGRKSEGDIRIVSDDKIVFR